MSSFGLDDGVGFLQKFVDDILSDIEDAEKAAFGTGINTTATSVFGQLNGVFAGATAENWEVLNEVYQSFNPNTATGAALDRIAALTGVVRLPATRSSLLAANSVPNPVHVTGDTGATLLAGRVVSVAASGDRFVSQADVVLAAAIVWTPTTAYVVGDVRENVGNIYIVTIAGTSAGAGGPSGELEVIVDGSVTWRFVGNGDAFATADFLAEAFGPVLALSNTMTIETPITGWSSAKNLLDALVGVNLETDAALRNRRNNSLRIQGTATLEAIRARLLDVEGVTEAIVFENDTIIVDSEGRPAKSIECVVEGGTDVDVAQAIFDSKAAGIITFGFPGVIVTEVITDSTGGLHTINFSRPDTVEIFVDITLDTDPLLYEGDSAVEAKIVEVGSTLNISDDVIAERIKCAAFEVAGVLDVTAFIIDITAIPPGTNEANIPMALRDQAIFDSARIDVFS